MRAPTWIYAMLCILIRYVVSPGPGELARYVVEEYTGVAPVLATEPNGVKPAIGELYLDVTKLAWTADPSGNTSERIAITSVGATVTLSNDSDGPGHHCSRGPGSDDCCSGHLGLDRRQRLRSAAHRRLITTRIAVASTPV